MMSHEDIKQLKRLGKNIRRLRVEAGLSQKELAERAKLSLVEIQQLEAGKEDLEISKIATLSNALKQPFKKLFHF